MNQQQRTTITKKTYRNQVSKLKKKILNNYKSSNWELIEKAKRNLAYYKRTRKTLQVKKKLITSNKRIKFTAPESINYYKDNDFEKMNKFLANLRDCIMKDHRVYIDFSLTEQISAAAMLSFLAEVDVLTKKSKHGLNSINFSHPKQKKIESILCQVGFYDLLRKSKRQTESYDDVTFWKYTSGSCSEPLLAKDMMLEIKKELEQKSSKKLYRGFTEAMSNSVEHAYVDDIMHTEDDDTAKWWTFAGIHEKQLTVVICDKGVGIPSTLPKTQGVSVLKSIFNKLGVSLTNVKDSAYIKASTTLQETRTGELNRGKGLNDIKSVIDSIGDGFMGIFSSKGRYIYKGKTGIINEVLKDYKSSVNGTIIEWTIPCEVETE
ncbi:ATP-binding protein [Cronobacter sakazakii]|uniref:ATP-binding protein n=1 Tax=Cronobacter sakazakii TaxID=28141 RepID=UPI000DA2040F|nr:ATP-binding protein [Cronobacter sakazakii]ELY2860860.1 ATP-binding protein [Cronobacter sakazakii]ELY4115120.1 ATP-binding protein [Cronobacter sakazakii]ELY4200163.1 ATP-binding protein [Cronobacter sakazakii]KAB0838051.1 ATP-binding protein [Cronobacter sakazakii]MCI0302329.1 ATP-binding protein [Cronobacter sakazakii]